MGTTVRSQAAMYWTPQTANWAANLQIHSL
jgi:hypothetical protein